VKRPLELYVNVSELKPVIRIICNGHSRTDVGARSGSGVTVMHYSITAVAAGQSQRPTALFWCQNVYSVLLRVV
jgi:hypothetical protein